MDKTQTELSKYRMEQARQCVKSAKLLVQANDYKGAANRSYYAIFHAMRSVLALQKVDFSKHSAVGAYFRKEFIKTNILGVELSDMITEAFVVRSDCDYDDYYQISKADVEQQISNAEYFCDSIEKYLRLLKII